MRALITGVCGQDGAYLAQKLLSDGVEVWGGYRRPDFWRLDELEIRDKINLRAFDLTDDGSIRRLLEDAQPDEVYNLAANSFVGSSWENPIAVANSNGLGPIRILEYLDKDVRFYQASTSEMYGGMNGQQILSEKNPFSPRSPYACAKLYAHHAVKNYGERGWKVGLGILFNHESPYRGPEFVTRKICSQLAQGKKIRLGNLSARRDWGHARDYVDAIVKICRAGGEYVVATGKAHSVKEFADTAADYFYDQTGIVPEGIEISEAEKRPTDVECLIGDNSKIRKDLGWSPTVSFKQLVMEMVDADLARYSHMLARKGMAA